MQIRSMVTFAVLTMIAMPAVAADPKPLTAREQQRMDQKKRDGELYREYQRQEAALKESGPLTLAGILTQRNKVTVKPHEVEMRIERYLDGTILYSTPVEPRYESLLYKGGKFRKVEARDQVNDRTVFNGRVYRVMRARGDTEQWKVSPDQDVYVNVQTEGGAQVAIGVRVKR